MQASMAASAALGSQALGAALLLIPLGLGKTRRAASVQSDSELLQAAHCRNSTQTFHVLANCPKRSFLTKHCRVPVHSPLQSKAVIYNAHCELLLATITCHLCPCAPKICPCILLCVSHCAKERRVAHTKIIYFPVPHGMQQCPNRLGSIMAVRCATMILWSHRHTRIYICGAFCHVPAVFRCPCEVVLAAQARRDELLQSMVLLQDAACVGNCTRV